MTWSFLGKGEEWYILRNLSPSGHSALTPLKSHLRCDWVHLPSEETACRGLALDQSSWCDTFVLTPPLGGACAAALWYKMVAAGHVQKHCNPRWRWWAVCRSTMIQDGSGGPHAETLHPQWHRELEHEQRSPTWPVRTPPPPLPANQVPIKQPQRGPLGREHVL